MNIIVEINGRQAIPVRALPLVTDWVTMYPQAVVMILAGEFEHWPSFEGLSAHRLEADGGVKQIPSRWWESWVVGKFQDISDEIKAKQTSSDLGKRQWRRESIAQLPVGVFVWRDEFEAAHLREYGAESMRARMAPETFKANTYALNFTPEPPLDIAPLHLVLEGFEPANLQATSPVTAVAASDEKPWLSIDPQDPAPAQPWYTPARYFARQLTIEKPALLANRELLADKVSTLLFNAGVKKRGGKKRFDSGTVLKAFANVSLG